ncbi:ThiF family adenylyltransferase [Ignatzschineria sp. RMDPL8A]|uniref:ThiF family adenylyltransferase n=1 Tax=Ignatzschineria sp. RMDPL8A TaxID=2999236 RepID=UPI0024467798|nr:ThiF family adenylyltransferase [Ignatzschineria sp. RMDPL8A]MDG9729434.1 ThiF family adenylyltransferase [Ignatzschineria sp. RMDPL8A]
MINPRYHRLARFHQLGEKGVLALRAAHVVIIGTGALGAQHAETLTRSGVGTLTLIDRDIVELTNLSRQTLFTEADAKASLPKVIALEAHLKAINHEVMIRPIFTEVSPHNIEYLLEGADLILDGTDNLNIRMLINDAAYKLKIPWIFGSALESYGMTYNFLDTPLDVTDKKGPCLRCLLGAIPLESEDTCSSVGVVQPILQLISSLQTAEAIKFLTGFSVRDTLFTAELWDFHTQSINLDKLKNPDCSTCGSEPTFPALFQADSNGDSKEKSNAFKIRTLCGGEFMVYAPNPHDFNRIKPRLEQRNLAYKETDYFLNIMLDDIADKEDLNSESAVQKRIMLFNDGRAIIYGEKDETAALTRYTQVLS